MTIHIHVTKEILEKTKSCKCQVESCAVSEAVREIFPGAYTLVLAMYPFPVSETDLGTDVIDLPVEAAQFILNFDRAGSDECRAAMRPISFDIEVPDSVIQRIGISQVESILSNSLTLEKV